MVESTLTVELKAMYAWLEAIEISGLPLSMKSFVVEVESHGNVSDPFTVAVAKEGQFLRQWPSVWNQEVRPKNFTNSGTC